MAPTNLAQSGMVEMNKVCNCACLGPHRDHTWLRKFMYSYFSLEEIETIQYQHNNFLLLTWVSNLPFYLKMFLVRQILILQFRMVQIHSVDKIGIKVLVSLLPEPLKYRKYRYQLSYLAFFSEKVSLCSQADLKFFYLSSSAF